VTEAALRVEAGVVYLTGDLVARSVGRIWDSALRAGGKAGTLAVDLSGCGTIDTAGAILVLNVERAHGGAVAIRGADERAAALIAQMRAVLPAALGRREAAAAERAALAGQAQPDVLQNLLTRISFFGLTIGALITLPAKLRFWRGANFPAIADAAGLQALPLVLMLGFLVGMILAFQSAVPMQQFGAVLYVADLVALALFRELGPLLVAVILAGRTGSAFAAELGTMQVNEEVAALTTMGIDPETMLVLPRIAAVMLVMPGLVAAIDIAGLLGMGTVMLLFGYPPPVVIAQINLFTHPEDFLIGLAKALAFAAAVALIGCRAGLTAGNGPRAVGQAATTAVVGGIVATVLLDGLFAVIFFRLGL
jgi:phospholipid/cholesterol/gamma-HCH transport system permease protein